MMSKCKQKNKILKKIEHQHGKKEIPCMAWRDREEDRVGAHARIFNKVLHKVYFWQNRQQQQQQQIQWK